MFAFHKLVFAMLLCTEIAAAPFAAANEMPGKGYSEVDRKPVCIGIEDAIPPAHAASDGHLVVTGQKTAVSFADLKYFEMAPSKAGLTFAPQYLRLLANGRNQEQKDVFQTEFLPAFQVEPPAEPLHRETLRLIAVGDLDQSAVPMQCVVNTVYRTEKAAFQADWHGEQLQATVLDRSRMGDSFLFLGRTCLGKLNDPKGIAQIDSRSLAAGDYRMWLVSETADGLLVAPAGADISVSNRYVITTPNPDEPFLAPDHSENVPFPIHVSKQKGVSAEKTLVYFGERLVGESDQADFDMALPLKDIPTGEATVEVVGVGKDGVLYPGEQIKVKIKNVPWENRVYRSDEYAVIRENRPKIAVLEQEVAAWYARAMAEPDFTVENRSTIDQYYDLHGRLVTSDFMQVLRTPGHTPEYLANAKRALFAMAQLQYQCGQYSLLLNMREWARNEFQHVAKELGDNSATGRLAKQQLAQFRKPVLH